MGGRHEPQRGRRLSDGFLRENESSPEIKARGTGGREMSPGAAERKREREKGGCMEEEAREKKGAPA